VKMDDPRRRDLEARKAAQTVFDRPVALEAGAGTGKTATLVARIAAWCLGPGWDEASRRHKGENRDPLEIAGRVLDGVVAITFTEDAAAEMARRVAQAFFALEEWEGDTRVSEDFPDIEEIHAGKGGLHGLFREAFPSDPVLIRERARALLVQSEALKIGTIHSFAASILGKFPLEAGLHPVTQVDADGSRLQEIVEELTAEVLYGAYSRFEEDCVEPAGAGIGPAEISAAAFQIMLSGISAADLERDPFDPDTERRILEELHEPLETCREELLALSGVKRAKKDAETAVFLLGLLEMTQPGGEDVQQRLKDLLETIRSGWPGTKTKINEWKNSTFTRAALDVLGEKTAFAAAAARIGDLLKHLQSMDPENFNRIRRVLRRILLRVEAEKHRRGLVLFDDLLKKTHRLLRERPAVLRRIRSEIHQLLVDEMQDTDTEQAAIVSMLALEPPAEERPCLFLVGDPKQSIYGWRKADLSVYESLTGKIEEIGGERRQLVINFRSVPAILEEVRRVVGPNMKYQAGIQPAFTGLENCARLENIPGISGESPRRRPIEHWIVTGNGKKERIRADEAARIEAEAVAADILDLKEDGMPLSGMCILMRSRGRLHLFLDALRRRNIPYVVGRDRSYFHSREIIEALALMRLILDPHDPLALLTVLRSPQAGVPDAALRPLWAAGLPAFTASISGREPLPPEAKELIGRAEIEVGRSGMDPAETPVSHWPHALLAFLEILAELRRSWCEDPPDIFLETLRQKTLLEVLGAGRFPGTYRLANIERFLRLMEERLFSGSSTAELLHWLRRMGREQPDEETGRPRRDDADAVRILTIHGAKGLEFEQVWLVQTHTAPATQRLKPEDAGLVDDVFEYRLCGFGTPAYHLVEERRKAVEEAELIRLLYVAMTRAGRRLVISGCEDTAGDKTLFAALKRREFEGGEQGRPALRDIGDNGDDGPLEAFGALWVLLHGAPSEENRRRQPSPLPLEKGKHVEAEESLLRKLREEARSHQQRRWIGAVSTQAHEEISPEPEAGIQSSHTRTARNPSGIDRESAKAVGTAFHRMLEVFDFGAEDAGEELEKQQEKVRSLLRRALPGRLHRQAEDSLNILVNTFHLGPLWPKWLQIGPGIIARELPLILPPPGDFEGATGALSGSIDLVYTDPDTRSPIIADFKTDSPEHLETQLPAYRKQLNTYAGAFQEALGLEAKPTAELWCIASGSILRFGIGSEM